MVSTRILLVQFRVTLITETLERVSIERELGSRCLLSTISALNENLQWTNPAELLSGVQGVIFGGSGDYDFDGGRLHDDGVRKKSYELLELLRPLFDYIFLHDIPTLGICYGHQIIGAYAGACVVHDIQQKKNRSHEVAVLVEKDAYAICANVPDTFYAHYGHKDSLDRVPEGAVLLMNGGDACKVSALCYQQNIFTTQFHPELTLEDLRLRMEATPGYLPDGVTIEDAFIPDSDSNTILKNFGNLVCGRGA